MNLYSCVTLTVVFLIMKIEKFLTSKKGKTSEKVSTEEPNSSRIIQIESIKNYSQSYKRGICRPSCRICHC